MATQAEYQDWQRQRIANGEDPNDVAAWRDHNARLGRDASITPGPATAPAATSRTYQTPNGARPIDQMRAELRAAGGNATG